MYEMPCKGVAVMKRRSDGWLNATQVRHIRSRLVSCGVVLYRLTRSRTSRAGLGTCIQILKVAGFDKPQRTRVLEREVQKGHHEKVQGGYGKYQGK